LAFQKERFANQEATFLQFKPTFSGKSLRPDVTETAIFKESRRCLLHSSTELLKVKKE